jgi:uroporphyrinogen decarboxylase
MSNDFGFEPDFENLKTVLMGGVGTRVPNVELVIDREIKEAWLGRPVNAPREEVEFRYRAGYDYVWVSVGMIDPAGTVNKEQVRETEGREFAGKDRRVWADQGKGILRTMNDVEAYPWPSAADLDYGPFHETVAHLKPGMKVIAILGKIFTAAWQLVGFERFCELIHDEPEMVACLLRRIGDLQVAVLDRVARIPGVGAVWCPDDIAYHTGPMLAPEWFRGNLWLHYRLMAEICRARGLPFIYHSDGNITSVVEDIIASGFNALHPIEPESLDIYRLRQQVERRLCLMGNIRVHLLATAAPEEIRRLVRDRLVNLGYRGGYCIGSSNSVPNYVKMENYRAMLETSAMLGRVPG